MAFGGYGMQRQRGRAMRRTVLLVALVTAGLSAAAASAEAREHHNPWHAGPPSAAEPGAPGGFPRSEPRTAGAFPPPDYDPARRERQDRSRAPAGEARPDPGMRPCIYRPGPYPYGDDRGPGYGYPGMPGHGAPFFGRPAPWGPFADP